MTNPYDDYRETIHKEVLRRASPERKKAQRIVDWIWGHPSARYSETIERIARALKAAKKGGKP